MPGLNLSSEVQTRHAPRRTIWIALGLFLRALTLGRAVASLAGISSGLEALFRLGAVVERATGHVVLPLILATSTVSLHRVASRAIFGLAIHLHGLLGGGLLHQQGLRLLNGGGLALELVLD